ncbi:MAG TPA: response regulator transcription factor [Anaerolineales bacterium]|nr:response regulator transcription factor [Anaerolineales bacterium]
MDHIRLLIVDDHPMMREALIAALTDEKDMEVIGTAANGIEGLKLAAEQKPDVILMDLLMPGMDGLECIARIVESNPEAKVLVVTSLEDEEKVLAAIQAGALGYFPKTAPRTFLLEAIHKVADGIPYLPAGIAQKLFKGIRGMKSPLKSTSEAPLTPRQEEILILMGEGRSDHEIGRMLHLEEATVRSHVHRIVQRLGVENRAQAVAYANGRRRPLD